MPPISLLEETVDHVVAQLSSLDISQHIADLPKDTETATGAFCDRFELGNWFYEALTLNEVDIGSMLARIAQERMSDEAEFAGECQVREYELRS